MGAIKLRAWWWHRQGLDGSLMGATCPEVLERSGWARSLGGANTYLTLFSRAGCSRASVDNALARLDIHELPSARGATYVVPAPDFGLALQVGRGASRGEVRQAGKLGFSSIEIEQLCETVRKELEHAGEPLDANQLRERLGDKIQSFGVAGRKAGLASPLPVVLGLLQERGTIRRVPADGRLDSTRLTYMAWDDPPTDVGSDEQAHVELVRRYLSWTGPAGIDHMRWFTGFGTRALRAAVSMLDAREVEPGLWLLPELLDEFESYVAPKDPSYSLVSWIDALALLRRDITGIVAPQDLSIVLPDGKPVGELKDFPHHLIIDRGRVVGFWEFDPSAGAVVWAPFAKVHRQLLEAAVERTEKFIVDQLGDARGSILDTPQVRQPRIAAVRAFANLA
ncbi:MAG: hypothetical protein HOQ05_01820 [Corynebacteriales bacterium]|nr:hypothetical protein [Mycobacteriales bacterium]